jgi:hydrogen cyanide synthase HcnB
VAALQGRIAALASLLDLGRIDSGVAETLATPLRRRLGRAQRCSRALLAPSVPRPGLLDLADADTVVCRCENVTRERLDSAVARGVTDMTTLKMTTRVGMGDCQGKLCGEFCRDYLRRRTGQQQVGELAPRFPLAPVPFEALLGESCEEV